MYVAPFLIGHFITESSPSQKAAFERLVPFWQGTGTSLHLTSAIVCLCGLALWVKRAVQVEKYAMSVSGLLCAFLLVAPLLLLVYAYCFVGIGGPA